MIREIINFTENLIDDIPEILQWKIQPSNGLRFSVDLDPEKKRKNKVALYDLDYAFSDAIMNESI